MRQLTTTLLACIFCVTAFAQRITVSGTVIEKESGEGCISANVVLLSAKDSSQVTGINSSASGAFTLPEVKAGNYILRISYVGFRTHVQNLTLTKKEPKVDLGTIYMAEDTKLMKEAVVSQNVAMVEQKEDTFVFNAAAYRLPPGSTLEALVKKLPGADVDNDGKITVNGKEVKKILVKGKEFFSSDTKVAMDNIPVDMVDRIKAYDKQSDYSRMTGIDDGEEETVLDLTIKKGMEQGWMINLDGGAGVGLYDDADANLNEIGRYSGKANISRFTDNTQMSLIATSNNTGDLGGMGGGGGGRFRGGGGGGLRTVHMLGYNFAWENGKKENEAGYLEVGGNARFSYSKTDSETKSNSETFLNGATKNSTFSNSQSKGMPWNWNFNTNYRIEWMPDSLTRIMFRPDFSYSRSHGESVNRSITFNSDPYKVWADPLNEYNDGAADNIIVNTNTRRSMSDSHSYTFNGGLQFNRRLGAKGRNLTFDVNTGYSHSESQSWNKTSILYYNGNNPRNQDKYTENPSTNWNVRGRMSYTEPITRSLNLQLSYSLQYRFSDNNRSQYERDSLRNHFMQNGYTETQFEQMAGEWLMGVSPLHTDLFAQWAKDYENSQYATYRELNHDASLMFRYNVGGTIRLNAGVSLQPQTTHMDYQKNQLDTTVTRHVFNWAPRVNFRWKISKSSQVNLRYNGRMSQPSMTNLLDIVDTSDPLNISRGNPGLDPSFTHTARLFYNNYIMERQMGWMTNLNYSNTMDAVSTATIYDVNTGARYTRPMNIDGNWNVNFFGGFNTALDKSKAWNVHVFGHLGYTNSVGYETTSTDQITQGMSIDRIFKMTSLKQSTTTQLNGGGRLNLTYRNDWLEIGPQGSFNYNRARNTTMERANMDTYNFGYGGNVQITLPWSMTITTDITQQGRRGYSDASMNTNELIWNAQISQSLLRGKNLILSLKAYDMLHQRSSISRALTATQRTDSWSKEINTYVMFHVTYKLNLLGKHANKAEDMNRPPFGGPDGPGGGPGGERPRGGRPDGFGGGQPGGFGGGRPF